MAQRLRTEATSLWNMSAVRRTALAVAIFFGAILLSLLAFLNPMLERYAKPKIAQAVVAAYPGSVLRVGKIEYHVWSNRLTCSAIEWIGPDATVASRIRDCSLGGVRWVACLSKTDRSFRLFRSVRLKANEVQITFAKSNYALRFGQLSASLQERKIEAGGVEYSPSVSDEEFFAAREFRRARLHLRVPKCSLAGLDSTGLLRGVAFRAESLELADATLDAFLNRDKPLSPNPIPPTVLNDVLSEIKLPVALAKITIARSRIVLAQRVEIGRPPGIMTFGAVELTAEGIGNHGPPGAVMRLNGQTQLMDTGDLKLSMEIPVNPSGYSFRYGGSLGPMDLTTLNPFLTLAGHTRIDSGALYEAAFEAQVRSGQAAGTFKAAYENLKMTVLDRTTGADSGFINRLKTLLADKLILRTSNLPQTGKTFKEGAVQYVRQPNDKLMRFLWLGIRSGMFDLLGIAPFVPPPK